MELCFCRLPTLQVPELQNSTCAGASITSTYSSSNETTTYRSDMKKAETDHTYLPPQNFTNIICDRHWASNRPRLPLSKQSDAMRLFHASIISACAFVGRWITMPYSYSGMVHFLMTCWGAEHLPFRESSSPKLNVVSHPARHYSAADINPLHAS